MTTRYAGLVVVGGAVTVVDAEVPDAADLPITVVSDFTWKLQKGERGPALAVVHQLCADYLVENKIERVVVKASAVASRSATLALLESAEVRGVVIAAAASVVSDVKALSKAVVSRTYGDRKVDDYLQDDTFWGEQTDGKALRKTSREAAMIIIAARRR
jgi:hypothetical protein